MTKTRFPWAQSARAVALGLTLGLAATALADQPYNFDLTPGRLSKDVVPTDYDIALTPDLEKSAFTGRESVRLTVRAATLRIVFDSADETLFDVRFDGRPVREVLTDNAEQLTTVTLAKAAAPGQHVLAFNYTGVIRKDVRGLFLQSYARVDGSEGRLLSSGFEPIDARMMFPGWDEPAFRARFRLSVKIPSGWSSVSNMPQASRVDHGRTTTITFQRSPPMPTYLVHVTAGEIARITSQAHGTELGVWAIRGQEQQGAVALAHARDILADYNEYFGFKFPLPKLDSIAIPGGFSGGMENWGVITYESPELLETPGTSLGDRQDVFSVQAHEMAHQWNGDLVTMAWWDNLWLNESFASFMAARETALRNPGWDWWENQDGDKEIAMNADASLLSHPIYQPVPDEAHANVASDSEITYSKGQAVLRMFESYLGADAFRDGVRRLMKARAFSNATSADLWQALGAASGRDVGLLVAAWTDQAGFPLVSVTAECGPDAQRTLRLTQERYLAGGTDPDHPLWVIPLRIRSGTAGSVRSEVFSTADARIPAGRCGEPLSVNADGVGFYRVRYDTATHAENVRSFARLPMADRIVQLDDQWALVKSGREAIGSYLELARAMGTDLDARAWEQIAGVLGALEIYERGTPGHAAMTRYARSLLEPIADQLGWIARPQETAAVQELRRTVLGSLGAWGDPAIVAEAQRRFAGFLADPKTIAADDQDLIFAIVADNADQATFIQLHDIAKSAKDPAQLRRAYDALALVGDPQLAAQAAQLALSAEIPPQEMNLPIQMLFTIARRNPQIAWHAYRDTERDLFESYGPLASLSLVQETPQEFWRAAPLVEIESWMRVRAPKELDTQIEHAMERARLRLAERDALVSAADHYIQPQK
jgi:aminopeptidase N